MYVCMMMMMVDDDNDDDDFDCDHGRCHVTILQLSPVAMRLACVLGGRSLSCNDLATLTGSDAAGIRAGPTVAVM